MGLSGRQDFFHGGLSGGEAVNVDLQLNVW